MRIRLGTEDLSTEKVDESRILQHFSAAERKTYYSPILPLGAIHPAPGASVPLGRADPLSCYPKGKPRC